ncbi:hypothetical protein [Phormidium nigroviride]
MTEEGYWLQNRRFTVQYSTPTTATEGNDTVLGTDLGDTLDGLGGDDRIYGVAGSGYFTLLTVLMVKLNL